ncbi:MAG TPA: carboxylating nicotinate-nucleotide diphosphorylase [Bryobacteraceae bacterium]|nr:carboxylating nicotinate-nucleotide diphosphorylase [Bryobacteraceae bacterium]
MEFDLRHPEVVDVVRRALAEDIGTGDLTTNATVAAGLMATGRFIARQPMTVCGVELLELVFAELGGVDFLGVHLHSGERAAEGDVLATVRGKARTLLTGERVALNFQQRLSGIATLTRRYSDAIAGTGCKLLDTRKTTPGLRRLEKWATVCGGAHNHRIGLFDAVLIKNNHITAAGGVREALEQVRQAGVPEGVDVEIEVRTRAELEEALTFGADHLLLDNLTPDEASEWIQFIAGRAKVELSGGMRLERLREYASTGTNYISVGALTHSAVSVDINFRVSLETA